MTTTITAEGAVADIMQRMRSYLADRDLDSAPGEAGEGLDATALATLERMRTALGLGDRGQS